MTSRMSNPVDELFDVFRDFDNLTRGWFQGAAGPRALPPAGPSSWQGPFHPAVDCVTKDGSIVLRMELPGVDPGEVEVNLVGNRLTIRGEKREQRESKDGGVLLKESAYGKFERSFTLPEGVKPDQVKARYTNGVLEVSLPAQELGARKVTIEVTGEPGRKAIKAAS